MKFVSLSGLVCVAGLLAAPCLMYGSDKNHCYLHDVAAPSSSSAYLMCEQGLVYATTDGGATWVGHDTGAAQTLTAIAFSDPTHGFVTGEQGTLLATADGGKTWQARKTDTTENLRSVFTVGNQAWTGGFDGTLLHSSDGGLTWNKQNSGTTMSVESLFFLDPDHGWAAGWSGMILRTADGGKTWQTIKTDAASWSLSAIRFTDLKNGWAVGFGGQLLRSRDGGATWETVKSTAQSWLTSVAFGQGNRMWIAADDHLLVSDDGGGTWRGVQIGDYQFVSRLFHLGNSLWAMGELGLYQQTGPGLQWKHDDRFVPAGAQIPDALDHPTIGGITPGKTR